MGRSGKKNPRLGVDFIKWVDEESIIKIILNTYDYVTQYIDPEAPGGKEHIGYIIDLTGVEEYLKWAMKDVQLPESAVVYKPLYWSGIKY
jgi:anaerobic sulfite reductase subunit C